MEKIKPRNRFKIERRGGTYRVTSNDHCILALFNDYEYIASHNICRKMPHLNPVYVLNRLTILRHELGLLECPPGSWDSANARYRPAIYRRTEKGTKELRAHGFTAVDIRNKMETFKHAFGVDSTAISFEIGVDEHPGLSLITRHDILNHKSCPATTRKASDPYTIKAPFTYKGRNGKQIPVEKASIRHDGFPMGFAHEVDGKTLRLFVPGIEHDRNTEPLDPGDYERPSITRKLCQMLELFKRYDGIDGYQEHYGIPNSVVPFWTINEQHMKNMMQRLHEITNGKGSDRILFACRSDFTSFETFPPATGWALTQNYKRVGFGDYNILAELGVEYKKAAA